MRRLASIISLCLVGSMVVTALGQSNSSMSVRSASTLRMNAALSLISQLTLEEKVDLLGGVDGFSFAMFRALSCRVSRWPMVRLACATLDQPPRLPGRY